MHLRIARVPVHRHGFDGVLKALRPGSELVAVRLSGPVGHHVQQVGGSDPIDLCSQVRNRCVKLRCAVPADVFPLVLIDSEIPVAVQPGGVAVGEVTALRTGPVCRSSFSRCPAHGRRLSRSLRRRLCVGGSSGSPDKSPNLGRRRGGLGLEDGELIVVVGAD